MQCPRCGFTQPQDEYCARCGVHLQQAAARKRKKMLLGLFATSLLLISGGLALALWIVRGPEGDSSPSASRKAAESPPQAVVRPMPPAPVYEPPPKEPKAKPQKPQPDTQPAAKSELPSKTTPEVKEEPSTEQPPPDLPEQKPIPEGTATEPDPEQQIKRWAAQEWFERGQELSDNSEEELALYQKALEIDDNYAPAQYYSGVIHLEWGDRDVALGYFRRFLQNATDEERTNYPIPEIISPDELEAPEEGN